MLSVRGETRVVKSFAWLRMRPKTLASVAAVSAVTIAITGMAFAYEGNPTAEVDLHDGGVWLTKTSSLMVGHFNNESRLLDGGVRTAGENYDVEQSGGIVLVTDRTASTLTSVDPARVVLSDAVLVPGGAKSVLGGSTVAILEPKSGKLWVVPSSGLSGFKAAGKDPQAYALGVGGRGTFRIGGTLDPSAKPLTVEAEVTHVLDAVEPLFREAVLRIGGIDLVVASRRRPYHDIADFTRFGLDPRLAKIVVVKSGYLSPELAPIANPSLMALTPGAVDQFVERLPRLRKAHPTYPFDDNFDFSPETFLSARSVGR